MEYNKLKSIAIVAVLLLAINRPVIAQSVVISPIDSIALSELDGKFNFIIANDLGRNGYYDQKPVAEMMGEAARLTGAKFVAAIGDVHHYMGVQSINDPLWMTNFELVYSHPELMIPWYPVLGNHEYEGNTKSVIEYSKVSRRWQMPSSFYIKEFAVSDSVKALLVFINTVPLIDKYRNDPEYPDASTESMELQLKWLDTVLKASDAKWKIVMGHHPIYAGTTKDEIEQIDLQNRLKPILEKNNTDFYFCGHIHNFQHFKFVDSDIDYIVNSSASLSRDVVTQDEMVFSNNETGFIVCTIENTHVVVSMINKKGKIIYKYNRIGK